MVNPVSISREKAKLSANEGSFTSLNSPRISNTLLNVRVRENSLVLGKCFQH